MRNLSSLLAPLICGIIVGGCTVGYFAVNGYFNQTPMLCTGVSSVEVPFFFQSVEALDIVGPGVYNAEATGFWQDGSFRVTGVSAEFRTLQNMLRAALVTAKTEDRSGHLNAVLRIKLTIYPNGTIASFTESDINRGTLKYSMSKHRSPMAPPRYEVGAGSWEPC